jgi:putative ABC transport system permease protein
MKRYPPRWADRFLEWYCRPALLEEIQGDAYELFYRDVQDSPTKARCRFVWNVLRFFRWKNIKKQNNLQQQTHYQVAMLQNIFKITYRNFMRYPGHSMVNVLGLSVGFACALLILLWVNHEYSYDTFHTEKEQMYKVITHVEANGEIQTHEVAGVNMEVSTLPEVALKVPVSTGNRWPHELCFRAEGKPEECVYLSGVYAGESFFELFTFPIVAGAAQPLADPTQMAITKKMAEALFGEENPVGKTIKIDGWVEVTVASVVENVPEASSLQFDFVMPLQVLQKLWGINDQQLTGQFFQVYLNTHVPMPSSDLSALLNRDEVIGEGYKAQKISYEAFPFTDWHLKGKFENGKNAGGRIAYVWLFMIIGAMVLVMAIINFVNMATARAALRAKEIGIRKVTGAHRSSLVFQFLGESFFIVFLAFLVSAFLVQPFLPFFNQWIGQSLGISMLSAKAWGYLAVGLLAVAFFAGLYPALVLSSFRPVHILKGHFAQAGTGSQSLRKGLMVVQLSVSAGILLFGAVVYSQMDFIMHKNLGFDRSQTLRVEPTYKLLTSYDAFKDQLLRLPSIQMAGVSDSNPLQLESGNITVEWPGKDPDTRISFQTLGCSADFPSTLGITLLEGRGFQPDRADTLMTEALVTTGAARRMGLESPLGAKISVFENEYEIVGVVEDFHTRSLHQEMEPAILYRRQVQRLSGIYVKYQKGHDREALEAVMAAFKSIEPAHTMKYWFQDDTFDALYKTEQMASRLVMFFAGVALVIAIMGIVGLSTFHIMRKRKEISIRRVFGATAQEVLRLLMGEFALILVGGTLLATVGAFYAARLWLEEFAYRTALPWGAALALVLGMATLVLGLVMLQGRQALQANPTDTLRSD